MSEMNCKGLQLSLGVASVRVGKCKDAQGNTYSDLGIAAGPEAGIFWFNGTQDRDELELEARADLGLIFAGQLSSSGSRWGWGLGGGAAVGVSLLLPTGHSTGVKTGR